MQTMPAISHARACDNREALRHFDLTEGYLSLAKRRQIGCTRARVISTHAAVADYNDDDDHERNYTLLISSSRFRQIRAFH